MSKPPAPRGELLQFTVSRRAPGISVGLMLEELFANNRELVDVLGRVCELCFHISDDRELYSQEPIAEALRCIREANRLNGIVEHNTLKG